MAELKLVLNGKTVLEEIAPDMLLLDFVRSQGCYSVKRDARLQTVVFALFWWMEHQCCPVQRLRCVRMEKR